MSLMPQVCLVPRSRELQSIVKVQPWPPAQLEMCFRRIEFQESRLMRVVAARILPLRFIPPDATSFSTRLATFCSLSGPAEYPAARNGRGFVEQLFRQKQISCKRLQNVLPWTNRMRIADFENWPAANARTASGMSRSFAQSPPPMTIAGPSRRRGRLTKALVIGRHQSSAQPLLVL
jgi:hypothetical protein